MGQFARAMLFAGALAMVPLGVMSFDSFGSSDSAVKMDKGGVSFSVGSGRGYYGRGYRRGYGRGYRRGYYRPYYNNYYYPSYGYGYGSGVTFVV